MSEQPEDRNNDSKKTAKNNIEQPEPLRKQDPTEPVTVEGGGTDQGRGGASAREGKGTAGTTL
jgi:hypothetical protein